MNNLGCDKLMSACTTAGGRDLNGGGKKPFRRFLKMVGWTQENVNSFVR